MEFTLESSRSNGRSSGSIKNNRMRANEPIRNRRNEGNVPEIKEQTSN